MTSQLKFFTLLILTLSLIACGGKSPMVKDDKELYDRPVTNEALIDSAETLLEKASQATGAARNHYLIQAARIFNEQKQYLRGQLALSSLAQELLGPEQVIEVQILMAELELNRANPREALKKLNISAILPLDLQVYVLRLRAEAFLKAGYPFESTKSRVQLDKMLSDEFDRELNHQAIWEALSLLPKTSLQQISQAPLNPDLLGWVELAKIAKRGQIDWQHLQSGIFHWRKRYPKHPAAKVFIRELGRKQIELIEQPEHIAVLLPLNGRYARVSSAIRDGIMSAYYQHPDKNYKPRISFVDTSDNQAAAWNYYQKAIAQGADFVIGPFLKQAVNLLVEAKQMDVPTLTLNYTNIESEPTHNLFQFGLLPEDEARQSAEMAFRQGRTHAAVLVPEGNWGERLSSAFRERFEELGGQVITIQTYTANNNDFKQPIQSMLNINQSYSRYRSVRNIMRTQMHFTPYRRQDVDMIFMAATPKDARQLKPQFKFHYAGEIPVYATSHAFTGQIKKQADRDIDDLNFCDMPWILNPPNREKQALINHWPEQQRFTRFFALGVDAYNLIPFLGRLQGKAYERFSGQTGNLYLDQANRIHRELLWAQFDRGIPKLVDISQLPLDFTLDDAPAEKQAIQ